MRPKDTRQPRQVRDVRRADIADRLYSAYQMVSHDVPLGRTGPFIKSALSTAEERLERLAADEEAAEFRGIVDGIGTGAGGV